MSLNRNYLVRKIKNPKTNQFENIIFKEIPLPKYTCAAIEGGGVKGVAYYGLYEEFYRLKVHHDIEHLSGSSAGSIAALVISLGFTPEEARSKLVNAPFADFLEGSKPWANTPEFLSNLMKGIIIVTAQNHSLSPGNVFHRWIQAIVKQKLGSEDATFRMLHQKIEAQKKIAAEVELELQNAIAKKDDAAIKIALKKKKKIIPNQFKYLYVTGTDVDNSETEIFSYDTYPDMPIADAVRISSSFPLFFKPVLFKNRYWVDGGLLKNLPAHVFQSDKFLPKNKEDFPSSTHSNSDTAKNINLDFHQKNSLNPAVIIIKIDTLKEIRRLYRIYENEVKLSSMTDHIYTIFNAQTETDDVSELRERFCIALDDCGISTLDFGISAAEKEALIDNSKKGTLDFLENHIDGAYSVQNCGTLQQWLESMSNVEIDEIIAVYYKQYDALLKQEPEQESEQEPEAIVEMEVMEIDPDQPSKKILKAHLEFLNAYSLYKRLLGMKIPTKPFERKFPTQHINIRINNEINSWNKPLKEDMENRLKKIIVEIKIKKQTLQDKCDKLKFIIDSVTLFDNLHNEHYAEIKTIVLLHEELAFLDEGREILTKKLNKKALQDDNNHQPFIIPEVENAKLKWFFKINSIKKNTSVLKILWKDVDVYLPVIAYQDDAKKTLRLDLRDEYERKIFFLATSLFLELNGYSSDAKGFKEMFALTNQPNNMKQLSEFLNVKGFELLASAFRLEVLLNHFEVRAGTNKKTSLDDIFKRFTKEKSQVDLELNAFNQVETKVKPRLTISKYVEPRRLSVADLSLMAPSKSSPSKPRREVITLAPKSKKN